ncbi:MAG: diguanylate cyclase [SAR324 cluster bacterium]|nr:diguanylate cyclase [SAR324 cluster bacterium]
MKSRAENPSAIRAVLLAPHEKLLDETLELLREGRYFQTMTPEILRLVLKTGEYLELPAGYLLIREGAPDDDMYFLLRGSVAVQSGGKVILRFNTPGDVVGEFAVISSEGRSADVITEEPSHLVRVSTSFLRRWSANPKLVVEFYTVFSHILAAKLRETSRRARLYDDAVLEAQEIATAHNKLEWEIEEKLKEILLYSKVIGSSHAAVLITDVDGIVINYNSAAAKLLERLDIRLQGNGGTIMTLVKDFDLGTYPQQDFGQAWSGEWSRRLQDDALVLQVTVTPIYGKTQDLVNIAFQMVDVSLQKAQEQAIARKNEEIKNNLLDLEATYQELQRMDLLKTETLNTLAAELGTPIRKILNHTGKLSQPLEELSATEWKEHLKAVREQSEYLKVVTENINYLIDLQADLQKIGTAPVDVRDVLNRVHRELGPSAERKSIKFAVDLPEEPLIISGDEEQFRTVFSLLVEQALMVSRQKSKLSLRGFPLENSDQVHLEIVYQGPSFKNISPTDGAFKGRTGLVIGLPLARKVISQYQGSLQFMGDKKHGLISVVLPRVQKSGEERPNRIMIVDDHDMDRMITKGVIDHLWPDSIILTTDDPFEFLDNYEDFGPDLVIIDPFISASGWSNHRVLAALMQNRRHNCPILAVSGLYKDFAERTIAVERGVTDFLEKPFSIFDLRFKVKSLLQSHRKEESLHHTMDQAQRQAYTDAMTKLANRKHFDEFLDTQIEYSRQTSKPCSLIMLDVDNFKHYNDTNGHQFGDEILKGIGRILATAVRSSDLSARYGGEEFVLVLPETRKEMAAVIAEKVRRTIEETRFPNMEKQPLGFVSASFGVATFDEDGKRARDLIKTADKCLYRSKRQGRNRVTVANQVPRVERHQPESRSGAGAAG